MKIEEAIEEAFEDMPETVKLFGKDKYFTKYWTPTLYAIWNKQIREVKYLFESKGLNPKYTTKRKQAKADDTRYQQEVFPLIIAIHNEDEKMLEYLWSINGLWGFDHLTLILHSLFSRTDWVKGIQIILSSQTSQDVYNARTYEFKNQFIHELFYRYSSQLGKDKNNQIRECLVERPYALMSLYSLMTDKKIENDPLIMKALSNIKMEDYAKMKISSEKEFMDSWLLTFNDFTKKNQPYTNLANTVEL